MKTPEDEAFDELARKQGAWGGGFPAKRAMAADKLHWSDCAVHNGPAYPAGPCDCGVAQPAQEPVAWQCREHGDIEWLECSKESYGTNPQRWVYRKLYTAPPAAQPAQEPEMLTIVYQSGYHDGKKAALAGREWNFCERCGKRTKDLTVIHTCTPPQGDT